MIVRVKDFSEKEKKCKQTLVAVAHHQLKIKQLVKLLCTRCGNIQPVGLHNRLNKYLNAGSVSDL